MHLPLTHTETSNDKDYPQDDEKKNIAIKFNKLNKQFMNYVQCCFDANKNWDFTPTLEDYIKYSEQIWHGTSRTDQCKLLAISQTNLKQDQKFLRLDTPGSTQSVDVFKRNSNKEASMDVKNVLVTTAPTFNLTFPPSAYSTALTQEFQPPQTLSTQVDHSFKKFEVDQTFLDTPTSKEELSDVNTARMSDNGSGRFLFSTPFIAQPSENSTDTRKRKTADTVVSSISPDKNAFGTPTITNIHDTYKIPASSYFNTSKLDFNMKHATSSANELNYGFKFSSLPTDEISSVLKTPTAPAYQLNSDSKFPIASTCEENSRFRFPTSTATELNSGYKFPTSSATDLYSSFKFPTSSATELNSCFKFPTSSATELSSGYKFPTSSSTDVYSGFKFPTSSATELNSGFKFPTSTAIDSNSGFKFPTSSATESTFGFKFPSASPNELNSDFKFPTTSINQIIFGFQPSTSISNPFNTSFGSTFSQVAPPFSQLDVPNIGNSSLQSFTTENEQDSEPVVTPESSDLGYEPGAICHVRGTLYFMNGKEWTRMGSGIFNIKNMEDKDHLQLIFRLESCRSGSLLMNITAQRNSDQIRIKSNKSILIVSLANPPIHEILSDIPAGVHTQIAYLLQTKSASDMDLVKSHLMG